MYFISSYRRGEKMIVIISAIVEIGMVSKCTLGFGQGQVEGIWGNKPKWKDP